MFDLQQLTHVKQLRVPPATIEVVRPGMALAMYYGKPLHEIADQVALLAQEYLDFIPPGSITAQCGVSSWGKFSPSRLQRQLKQLCSPKVDYTNIDLGSGVRPDSMGPYGWHVNGGNLSNSDTWPNDTNVIYFEFPWDYLESVGHTALVDWVIKIAGILPFDSGQFGYSFNQLQRTWTSEADEFVGKHAMRFRGLDILEPMLARKSRGLVPNCSWLNLWGTSIVRKLGGVGTIQRIATADITVTPIQNGVLVQAGSHPVVGDVNRQPDGLNQIRTIAKFTRPLRVSERFLFYGNEDFRHDWVNRFDE